MISIEISLAPDRWYIATLGGVAQWSWGGPAQQGIGWEDGRFVFIGFRSISVVLTFPRLFFGEMHHKAGGAILVGFFLCQGTPGMRVSSRRCRGAALHADLTFVGRSDRM